MTSSLRRSEDRHVDWVAAAAAIGRIASDECDVAQLLVDEIRARCDCDLVTLVEPAPAGMLRVVAAAGPDAGLWRDMCTPAEGTLSVPLLRGAGARRVRNLSTGAGDNVAPITGIDDVLLVPVPGDGDSVRAVLTLGRRSGRVPFADGDLVPATMLALQFASALRHQALAAREQRRVLAEERDRIAQVMQAQVIQRLFALGLTLQAAAGKSGAPVAAVLEAGSDDLDEAIKAIRTTIYRVGG